MKKEVNFFAQMRGRPRGAALSGISLTAMPVVLAAALMLALWVAFTSLGSASTAKINAFDIEIGEIVAQQGAVTAGDVVSVDQMYQSENLLTTTRLKTVFDAQPNDLSVRAVSYEAPMLRLDCWSPRKLCGADFAALLRHSQAFADVGYSGVSATDGGYGFSITLSLAGEGDADAD